MARKNEDEQQGFELAKTLVEAMPVESESQRDALLNALESYISASQLSMTQLVLLLQLEEAMQNSGVEGLNGIERALTLSLKHLRGMKLPYEPPPAKSGMRKEPPRHTK